MRPWILAFSCVPLLACAAPTSGPDEDGRQVASWRGQIESAGTCLAGDLFVMVESDDGARWEGTAYYESVLFQGNHYRATYAVEGTLDSGSLHLVETEIAESDQGGPDFRWCTGAYRLQLDGTEPLEQAPLSGHYEPFDCSCGLAPTSLMPLE